MPCLYFSVWLILSMNPTMRSSRKCFFRVLLFWILVFVGTMVNNCLVGKKYKKNYWMLFLAIWLWIDRSLLSSFGPSWSQMNIFTSCRSSSDIFWPLQFLLAGKMEFQKNTREIFEVMSYTCIQKIMITECLIGWLWCRMNTF